MGKGKLKKGLASVFTRKEGGTVLGNLVRGVGDKFTGGMVSRFMPPSTAEQVAAQQARRGKTGNTSVQTVAPGTPQASKMMMSAAETAQAEKDFAVDVNYSDSPSGGLKAWFQTNKKAVIIGGVIIGVCVAVWAFIRGKRKKK